MKPRTLGDLQNDQKGAVMVIGLFMAMFLIGAMWTVVGLGDAIVFRDRAQEAADHMAFTAATVHARGMNFIAGLNLVMLAIVAVWLVIDAIDKILWFTQDATILPCASVIASAWACPVNAFADAAYGAFHPFHEAYKDGMKPVLTGLSWAQTATAMLAPYGGMAASLGVSAEYKTPGVGVSISMLPEFAISGGLKNGSYNWGNVMDGEFKPNGKNTPTAGQADTNFKHGKGLGQRLGLPVQNMNMNYLCIYASDYVLDWIFQWLGKIPVANLITKIPFFEGFVKNLAGSAIATASCNEYLDGFWGRDGPKSTYGMGQSLAHGNDDYHQVYGLVYTTENDVSENKIALGMGPKYKRVSNPSNTQFYVAQSEFFFDCDKTWTDLSCNGPGNQIDIPRALFSMRWMVRMRRVHYPSVGQILSTWLSNNLTRGELLGPLKGKIAQSGWFKNIEGKFGSAAASLGGDKAESLAGSIFGGLVKTGNGPSAFDNAINDMMGQVQNKLDSRFPGLFHNQPVGGIVH